jgi:hypothetical protein
MRLQSGTVVRQAEGLLSTKGLTSDFVDKTSQRHASSVSIPVDRVQLSQAGLPQLVGISGFDRVHCAW